MIALVTTVFALLISSMAGYGFEIYQSKTKRPNFQYSTAIDDGSFCGIDDPFISNVFTIERNGFGNQQFLGCHPAIC